MMTGGSGSQVDDRGQEYSIGAALYSRRRSVSPAGWKGGDGQEYCDRTRLLRRLLERGKRTAPSPRSEMRAAFRLSRGEALILVLLLSLGLWAATWGAVALLAMAGRS